jgi:YD repeat-containing protein
MSASRSSNQRTCDDFIECLSQFVGAGSTWEVERNKQKTGSDVVVQIRPRSQEAAPIDARLELDFGVWRKTRIVEHHYAAYSTRPLRATVHLLQNPLPRQHRKSKTRKTPVVRNSVAYVTVNVLSVPRFPGYDEFNRLTSRTVTQGTVQNFTYTYDRYGNRWTQGAPQGGPVLSISFNTANNIISTSGFANDIPGNISDDSLHGYSYDADGNLISVDSGQTATYYYDSLNQRVREAPTRGTKSIPAAAASATLLSMGVTTAGAFRGPGQGAMRRILGIHITDGIPITIFGNGIKVQLANVLEFN